MNGSKFITALCFLISSLALAQTYSAYNISLVKHLTPNKTDFGFDNRKYSGCWGWYQASKNKEYAISGTSNGTYFIDMTAATNASVCAFVQGVQGRTYREMKTYKNYCYIISDDGQPVSLQIVNMQYLPDSLPIVYSGNDYFSRAHTIWIDDHKMYLGSVGYQSGFSSMAVYSLADPENPQLLRRLEQDFPFINIVHDMYSRHDTIYASCANQGLYVFKFDSLNSVFTQLGSYTGFPNAGYNHSSVLTDDGKHLVFCEEIPAGVPIRVVNVENKTNIQPVKDFIPHPQTTPHNPFMLNNFAIVSCYEDGLYIYDLTDIHNPSRAGFFDTYPQGGANTQNYGEIDYRGNWGAYPYLPSKLIVANDMQNGIFILDATAAYTTTTKDPVAISNKTMDVKDFNIYPNPLKDNFQIELLEQKDFTVFVKNILGNTLIKESFYAATNVLINTAQLNAGTYMLTVTSQESSFTKKIIIVK